MKKSSIRLIAFLLIFSIFGIQSSHARWLQTDPVGYEGGQNLYVYVENDPVNFNDPDGHAPESVMDNRFVRPRLTDNQQQEVDRAHANIGEAVAEGIIAGIAIAVDIIDGPTPDVGAAAVGGIIAKKRMGTAGGPRAGKKHTRAAIAKAKADNAARNNGNTRCVDCNDVTTPTTRRTKGSTVNPREGQGDHIHPRSEGGDGATVKDQRNIDIRCAQCNAGKGNKLPF